MVYNRSMIQRTQKTPVRIGILGGRFDPVHFGHIAIAKEAREQYNLDTVLLLVAKDPPHKPTHASAQARYEMAELAAGEEGLECSRIELDRAGTTYSVDSLRLLRAQYGPDAALFYIIGADTLLQLPSWKQFDEVSRLCDFIVFYRPGEDTERVTLKARELRARFGESVLFAGIAGPDISSTAIRERIRDNLPLSGCVCAPVERYIHAHGLYRTSS